MKLLLLLALFLVDVHPLQASSDPTSGPPRKDCAHDITAPQDDALRPDIQALPVGTQVWGRTYCKSCKQQYSLEPNSQGRQQCAGCGAAYGGWGYFFPEEVGARDIADTEVERMLASSGKAIKCDHCGSMNFNTGHPCPGCGAGAAPPRAPRPVASEPVSSRVQAQGLSGWWIAGGVGGLGAVGTGLYFLLRDREVPAQVVDKKWKTVARKYRFEKVSRTGWADEVSEISPILPGPGTQESSGSFNLRNYRDEDYQKTITEEVPVVHIRSKQVPDGTRRVSFQNSRQVPYTVKVKKDNKNGSYTIVEETRYRTEYFTDYRDEIAYRTVTYPETVIETRHKKITVRRRACDYDTYIWQEVGNQHLEGSLDSSIKFGDFSGVDTMEKVVNDKELFLVFGFEKDKQTETVEVKVRDEVYENWRIGEPVILTVHSKDRVDFKRPE